MERKSAETPRNLLSPTLDTDWSVVFACALCLMFSVGTLLLYTFGVFVRPLSTQFHWTRTQISGALTLGQFTVALSCPIWGYLVDRFGPRTVILPSIVGMSLVYASLALLTPHLPHLYVVFVVFTLLGGAAAPVGYAAVLVRSFDRRLGLALGFALMGIGLGAAVLPPLMQWIIGSHGWRGAYAALGLATLAITLPAAIFATRNARLPAAVLTGVNAPIGAMVMTRAFCLMCLIFILLGVASGGTLAHLVPMMVDRGFAPPAAAKVASLAGLAVIAGRAGIGWLLDRFNAARLLALVGTMIGAALALLVFSHGKPSSYLAALLIGSVLGAEVDFTAFLVRRYFGNAAFGRLYGIAFGVFSIGVGSGPLLLGLSFDRLGSYRPGLFAFIAISMVAAMLTFSLSPYTSKARSAESEA